MPYSDLTDESLTDIQSDLFDELDRVQLKPSRFFRIIKPTFAFIIPGIIIAAVTGYFFEAHLLVYLAFIFGIFLAATGMMFFIVLLITRLSTDKNTYTFTKGGFVVESKNEVKKFFPWDEITDVELIGKGEGNRIPRICTVKTKNDEVVIRINKFYEASENTGAPDSIVEIISMYYRGIFCNCVIRRV